MRLHLELQFGNHLPLPQEAIAASVLTESGHQSVKSIAIGSYLIDIANAEQAIEYFHPPAL
ncbi:MAG: hypothetical protein Q7U63_01960 [Polaromonas sp.]|uniref:hypothetical protein n=1 Tax=Polaromonas sp. TaxID=1869339 RepID=UPI00271DA426|nr:hypothetical protein [Polaromonas sp.]MDO9112539.1 hypothetical protein [Polaromonas sp.]MDP1887180.1 hypothetical protein [Polaromonas sp.]